MTAPRFSFVATSRNDDHGGDVLRRTQSFINRLAEQCERHQVPSELILVEWNPPPARPALAEVLAWPAGSKWFSARVLTVPREVHLTHRHGSRLSLFQMIAKNVGIRHAAGEHVIATNIDIIFSDELFERLRRGDFRDGALYRSDRWDIPNEIQLEPDLDVLLRRARDEAIRRNRREGTYIKRGGEFVNSTPNRFDDVFYNPVNLQLEAMRSVLAQESPRGHDEVRQRLEHLLSAELPRLRRNFFIPVLHTNGCGDFTMLSRNDWFRLRGYPEWHVFSWTIDSMLLLQAHYNGITIEEFDAACVHYHIEHDYGSGWTPEGAGTLWARLDERSVPYMSFEQYARLVHELQDKAERDTFTIYNGSNWGLAGRELQDLVVVADGSPARPSSMTNAGPLVEPFLAELKPVDLGPTYQAVFRPEEGAQLVFEARDDSVPDAIVETRTERWSYAIEVDLTPAAAGGGARWIEMSIAVESGCVSICILNPEGSDFIQEKTLRGPTAVAQEVTLFVEEIGRAGNLIFRNVTEGGLPARFTISGLRIFADLIADEEYPMFGERPTAPGVVNDDHPAVPTMGGGLSAMRAGAPGAILRLLAAPETERNAGIARERQLVVVTPAENGAWGGVLDLPREIGAGTLAMDLHVIAGTAGIGVRSRTTDEVVEYQAIAGAPLTRVQLDLAAVAEPGTLIVRNLSSSGPARLLIHRLYYGESDGDEASPLAPAAKNEHSVQGETLL